MNKIDVLDHGFVRLVDHMGGDVDISRAARVSYNADPREEDDKLIGYLMRNKHTSPFEAVQFTFEVKAPIFVFRQWHRHRTWSYNEVSARYTELPTEAYIPHHSKFGKQSKHNKQMRDLIGPDADNHPTPAVDRALFEMHGSHQRAFEAYKQMIKDGIPRELARSVLPVATYSRMFASVNLHNLFHFLRLRLHEHAQYEIRVYVEAIVKLIKPVVPIAVKHFEESLCD